MTLPERFYITTAIDYINGKPHIGHSYEKVAADVLSRYFRNKGVETYFLTGTDEHGAKIAQFAEQSSLPIEQFARETAASFSFAWDSLQVNYDRFIRTTDSDHETGVQQLITKIRDNGYLYEADYQGLYCVGHEAFITEKDLVNGLCPEHQTAPELITEKNWFFKVSAFTDEISEKIRTNQFQVWPASSKQEVLSMLEAGFTDIAVTRPNVKWGIPVPWEPEQTIYVWVDALINYVTGVGYINDPDNYQKYWPADWHVIGRDITKFHCIIWPALLLAAGLPMPKGVMVHGYLTLDNKKISKSLGNIVDPNDWVAKYGSDAVRYFLMREVPWGSDGDVSESKLRSRYDSELANALGNLISRITTLIEKYSDGSVVKRFPSELNGYSEQITESMKQFRFHEALSQIWELLAWGNKAVDEHKLWELGKSDIQKFQEIAGAIIAVLEEVANHLKPFMPETSLKISSIISVPKIAKAPPLFPKID